MEAPKETLPGLTESELQTLKKVFSSPLDIPAEWKAWLVSYLEANPPGITFAQVTGYQNFVSTQVSVYTSTGAASFAGTQGIGAGATSSAGPSITLGPAGKYVIEAAMDAFADSMTANLAVSGGGPTVQGGSAGVFGVGLSVSRAVAVTIASDGEVLTSTFNVGPNSTGVGRDFQLQNAAIIATRYAN